MEIDKSKVMFDVLGIEALFDPNWSLGLIDSTTPNTLSYISSSKYKKQLEENANISCVFTTKHLAEDIKTPYIVCDDPTWAFWTLFNYISRLRLQESIYVSRIHPSAKIHPTAFIDAQNVEIGENTVIGANAVIHPGVIIGRNCLVGAGSVIGFDGFEKKRTSKGIISVVHDGLVIINDEVEIGTLNSIAKGFNFRNTFIDSETKIDSLVFVAHGVKIGKRCLIIACAEISGGVVIGDDSWLGPNCSIINGINLGNKVLVGIGAVVIKSFGDNSVLAGNPAKLLRTSDM